MVQFHVSAPNFIAKVCDLKHLKLVPLKEGDHSCGVPGRKCIEIGGEIPMPSA